MEEGWGDGEGERERVVRGRGVMRAGRWRWGPVS